MSIQRGIATATEASGEVKVECDSCGRSEIVNGEDCFLNGWPQCCGYTMYLVVSTLNKGKQPTIEIAE